MIAPMLKNLKFHHLGLAVRQDTDAIIFLQSLGYSIGEKILDPLQNVHLRLCVSDDHPVVEIVQPGTGKNPIDSIVSKYNEIVYHTCYETADLPETLATIESLNLHCICLSERKPAILFGGKHVSFYRIAGFGIIELLERI
jgi:hypothetical protein